MEAQKFTPGPWQIEPIFGDGDLSIVLGYDIPEAGRPVMIAHAVDKDEHGFCPATQSEAIANARLMAAGPALYDACKAGAEEIQICPNCNNVGYTARQTNDYGGCEQEQCEFCYTVPNSLFNLKEKCRVALALANGQPTSEHEESRDA